LQSAWSGFFDLTVFLLSEIDRVSSASRRLFPVELASPQQRKKKAEKTTGTKTL
jgi:hypothetical protein